MDMRKMRATPACIPQRPLLCLVIDPAVPDLLMRVEAALDGGVNMLQLRAHNLTAAALYELALTLRPLCRRYQATFIVNDRIDVGVAVDADGLQLGKRSLPISVARRLLGDAYLLGASVHSLQEACSAAREGADFLLAGTIFHSSSHPEQPGCGTVLLRSIRQALPTCQLIAIGGITAANAGQVMLEGADGVAAISAILAADDTRLTTRQLLTVIQGGLEKRGIST